MRRIFIDFETYFDRTYSLSKMTTMEYILHEKFQVLGCAMAIDDQPGFWVEGEELPELDWANSEVIAHNNFFDSQILTLHYGIRAKRYGCTASMARALMPIESVGLKYVAPALGLGHKTEGLTIGSKETDAKLIDYAINDVELCRGIYNKLGPIFPEDEREVLNVTIRWGIDPKLVIDIPKMQAAQINALDARNEAILNSGLDAKTLTSQVKMAQWIADQGIEVPTKPSLKNGWPIPALGKMDPEFHKLREEHPELEHVWKGRLAAKSNIIIKRCEKLLNIAKMTEDHLIPMPLQYYGASTGRWSGHEINVQNLPREGNIRESIAAPKGYKIVVADSSQIELRVNAWYSGEQWILDTLKNGEDIYKITAARRFNCKEVTKQQRSFAKAMVLGLGYGMGPEKFLQYCASGPLGMAPIHITVKDAMDTVMSYRRNNPKLSHNWKVHDDALKEMWAMANPKGARRIAPKVQIGPVVFNANMALMPNGMPILYPNLTPMETGWVYGNGKFIYGAKLVENIVQGLARIIISEQLLMMEREGIQTVSSTHDEILAIFKDEDCEAGLERMIEIMSTPPAWAEGIALAAEGKIDRYYSK